MSTTSVTVNRHTLERARALTGATSNRAAIDLALRELFTSKQRGMLDGISQLTDLANSLAEIGAIAPELAVPPANADRSTYSSTASKESSNQPSS